MDRLEFNSYLEVFDSVEELSKEDQTLFSAAKKSCENAYADYSNFHVGAAVRLANGEIIEGNNQENIAYPSGLCAERVAVFYAMANFPNEKITGIAIYAKGEKKELEKVITPCGSCRQVLIEYEQRNNSPIPILMEGEKEKVYRSPSVEALLPFFFKSDLVQKKTRK